MTWLVREISTEQVQPIRLAVLRADTPTRETRFAEDDWPGCVHLGAFDGDTLIATSTWIPREITTRPGVPAVQLRGMATLQSHQSRGVGSAIIATGLERARAGGAMLVWANARDAAMAFYEREGFRIEGDGFVDATTQLPHHVVVIDL